jgi:hypothetical protein
MATLEDESVWQDADVSTCAIFECYHLVTVVDSTL